MTPLRAHSLLIMTAIFWGLGSVSQKLILDHLGPVTATGLTSILAALVLSPFAYREQQQQAFAERPGFRDIAATALVFTAAVVSLQVAFRGTSVTNAGFLVNTCAALTPLAAWLVLREKPTQMLGPAILLIIVGAWLISGGTLTSFAWGDAVCILSAVFYAFSVPMVSRFVLRFGRPAFLTCVQFVVCGAICTFVGLIIEPVSLDAVRQALPEIIVIGVVAKGLAYLLMAIAQQHTTANAAAIIVSAEAIFGAVCATVFLGEMLTITGSIGAGLILMSIIIIHLSYPFTAYGRSLWL